MVNSTGSIATYLVNTFSNLPAGISGTMLQTVEFQRMYVQNYTGQSISSAAVGEQFEPIITNLAMAFLVSMNVSNGAGGTTTLGELSVSDGGTLLSAQQYKSLAEMQLKAIPRAVSFVRSISA
jgi:hypothetical protein